ncbi:unnamed protein product [Heterobilharzia americana]|nr:unnamed protein product [Heterobilharzia americana]
MTHRIVYQLAGITSLNPLVRDSEQARKTYASLEKITTYDDCILKSSISNVYPSDRTLRSFNHASRQHIKKVIEIKVTIVNLWILAPS